MSIRLFQWLCACCREIALEILAQQEIGAFIVRDSTTHPHCYALSVKVPKFDNPSGISHYLIFKSSRGVKLKVRTVSCVNSLRTTRLLLQN